jgi:hypothetical protein
MGCDYYILKSLQVFYQHKCDNDNDYLEIELKRRKGYYVDEDDLDEDEDEADYDKRTNEYIKYTLTPKIKPIIIYDNNRFTKPFFEKKYKSIVENVITNMYDKQWGDVTKIVKVEERRER